MNLAIFDLDGVIVDTVPLHYKAWERMFKEAGVDFTYEMYIAKVDGLPRLQGIQNVLTDIDQETLQDLADKKQSYYLEYVHTEDVEPFPDTLSFMVRLRELGFPIAVASSSRNARLILEKIGLTDLATVVDGNDFERSKPEPDIFLKAAANLNAVPDHCVVMEDALAGIQAAQAAGMHTIGICRDDDKERLASADFNVSSLDEIVVEKKGTGFICSERHC